MQEQPLRVLYCTDFSENASRAFAYALEAVALRKGSELHLIHVIPEPDAQFWKSYIYDAEGDVDEKAKKDIDEKIDREYRPQIPEGLVFKTAFRIGKSHLEILKYAEEIGAGLIVLGRQGTGALTSLLIGSVAEKVVQKAHCPVLVIPPDK